MNSDNQNNQNNNFNNSNNKPNKYVHDEVSITINDKEVKIPNPPHPSEDPTAYLTSYRTGEKVPIARLQKLYDVYGSYAKVAKETGISDKTIKRYIKERAPIESTPSEHLSTTKAQRDGFAEVRTSKTQHIAIKASKIADTFMESNSDALSSTMNTLLESLQDPVVISRAPLRDRAIAWGIVTERLQKSKELAIRQDEAEIKRIEVGRRDMEIELRKREIAAMEKGITISVNRNFQDVGNLEDVEVVDVKESKPPKSDNTEDRR